MWHTQLKAAIERGNAMVSVIGQGYVGLPLALSLSSAGYQVYGIDVNEDKIQQLRRGLSYIIDVSVEELQRQLTSGNYVPTVEFDTIRESQVVIICVPTPLSKSKDPDVSYIVQAMDKVKLHSHSGLLVILESTTYPGTTDELIVAELEKQGYVIGQDFFVCFSPERVDPGNPTYKTANTPKVVGGVTPACSELGALLYGRVMSKVVPVTSARVAEMVKLLENTFRAVNIGLVNELALMCERMDIDIWEVIDAAATKPFGFMPFYPGPGIGGHCIPLDPMYLSWKARMFDFYNKFINLASDINGNMPRHVIGKIGEVLNLESKSIRGSRILMLGITYKRDINDLRESPSLEVYKLLKNSGATVDFHDPMVDTFLEAEGVARGIQLSAEGLGTYDCVVLTTDHRSYDYGWIAQHAQLVVDTRNAFRHISGNHIIRLGVRTPTVDEWKKIRALSGV